MKRLGLAALVVLMLAVAAWLLIDRGVTRSPVAVADDDARTEAPAPTRDANTSPSVSRPTARPLAPKPFPETEWTAPAESTTLRVLVVEEATGNPVAGAEVAATDGGSEDDEPRSYPNAGGGSKVTPLIATFNNASQQTVTDEHGIAFVRTCAGLSVAARRGDLFGSRQFAGAPLGEARLGMKPGWLIAAKVVTASGDPVPGIPVVLRKIFNVRAPTPVYSQMTVITRKPDGIAVMEHLFENRPEAGKDHSVAAWIEGVEATSVQAHLYDFREGPLTITLPPGGPLGVALLDPDGKLFTKPAQVFVGLASPIPLEQRQRVIPFPSVRANAIGGAAMVPFVPAGFPLCVVGSADEFELVVQDLQPLESTSAVTPVALRFTRRRSVLVGRIVDETGAPMARHAFRVEMVTMGPPRVFSATPMAITKALQIETDAGGKFSFPAVERHSLRSGGLQIDFELETSPDVVTHAGSVSVTELSETGQTQLGDVKVVPPEVLAAGIVVDELGAPLAGAIVSAQPTRTDDRPEFAKDTPIRARPLLETVMRTRSDASGAFALTVPVAAGRWSRRIAQLTLKTELDGYGKPAPVKPYDAGRRDIRIVLPAAGSIEGRLVVPEDLPLSRIQMLVTRAEADPRKFEDCVDSDGHFRLRELPPGVVSLSITRAGHDAPLATLAGVTVPRLGATSDPRLQPIRIR